MLDQIEGKVQGKKKNRNIQVFTFKILIIPIINVPVVETVTGPVDDTNSNLKE